MRSSVATLLLVISSVCFGLVPLFGRTLLDLGLSAEAIALYRFGLALPLAVAFLPRRRSTLGPAAALVGVSIAMGLGWTTYLRAIEHVSLASAGVVYMSYPLFVVLLARLMVGHRLTPRAILGATLVLAGAFIVNAPAAVSGGNWLVLLSSLPAPIGFALTIVLLVTTGQRFTTLERWSLICVGAVIGLLPAVLARGPGTLVPQSSDGWLWVAALALVTATLPQLLYIFAARYVSPARAAASGAVELPTMIAIGWLAFAETVGLREVVGAALVVAAIATTPAIAPQRAAGTRKPATSEGF